VSGAFVGRAEGAARWPDGLRGLVESLVAVLVSLALGSAVLVCTGHSPWVAVRELARRVVLRPAGLEASLVQATPLLMVGVAILLTTRAGLWNIGIDGQVLAGAIAAAMAAHAVRSWPPLLIWLLAAIAALIGGAVWMLVPAFLRSRSGINEIVTTIMFNCLAFSLASWLVKGPLRDESLVSPQLPTIPRGDRLTTLFGTRVHIGLIVAVLLVAGIGWWLTRTQSGFEARVLGESARVARHAMIPVSRLTLLVMLAGGALAGLAGANDVLSTRGTVQAEWSPAYGLAGYALVFLARRRPLALLPSGVLLGMLAYGADVMPRAADVPAAFFPMLEGMMLLVLAVAHWRSVQGGHA